jgi:hypothetical protein
MNVWLEVLGSALAIWEHKEARKYLDEWMSLKKDWYDEYNQDPASRDHAELDRLEFRLRLLGSAFITQSRKPDSIAKP